ncbi:hypothetical protein WICPIJ_008812 [Wickerhamomyces pijperi]|uniref:Uncharacterized protein n=1 Tax=Wickerhamomyces pijperi TaxID=599730 RepID=A0A9P8PWK5_WICPI|nr:hypothetical protein WICPIJ_008812 [Wickerhamomyces pijperi]
MTELHFNINPAESLGDLKLGTYLNDTLNLLTQSKIQISLRYDSKKINETPLVLKLIKYGIHLIFNPKTQRMIMIDVEIPDLDHINVKQNNLGLIYCNEMIHNWKFTNLYNEVFGPTRRGVSYDNDSVYMLNYPGLTLKFDIGSLKFTEGSDIMTELLTLPQDDAVKCKRLYLHEYPSFHSFLSSQPTRSTKEKLQIKEKRHTAQGDKSSALNPPEIESIEISPGNKIKIHFLSNCRTPPLEISLHESTPDQIIRILGPPDAIYVKKPSKLKIHNIISQTESLSLDEEEEEEHEDQQINSREKSDEDFLYHNYFRYGVDFLYDHSSSNSQRIGTLIKVIFHNNLPSCHSTFRTYNKSQYRIPYLTSEEGDIIDSSSSFNDVKSVFELLGAQQKRNTTYLELTNDPIIIMNDSAELMVDSFDRIEDYSDTKSAKTLQKSMFYVMSSTGMVWEVINDDQIESLTLF